MPSFGGKLRVLEEPKKSPTHLENLNSKTITPLLSMSTSLTMNPASAMSSHRNTAINMKRLRQLEH